MLTIGLDQRTYSRSGRVYWRVQWNTKMWR